MENDKVLGIVLIAIGALLLLGWLRIPFLSELVAIALIVVGVLMLMGRMAGATWVGALLIVLGAIVLLKGLPFLDDLSRTLSALINTVVAVVCIVLGVLKLMHKV